MGILKEIIVDAYAKVNLSLDVLGKRQDGYHDLRMIMQQISLKDEVVLTEIEEDSILIGSNSKSIPKDSANIAYRAAKLLKDKFGIKNGVSIFINKHIPVSAGLAGGSTDAAATMKGLNEMWDLGISRQDLMDMAKSLGADIPYCIHGGTALAEGIGEKITPLKGFKNKHLLLANPDVEVSTAEVYQNLDLEILNKRPDTKSLIEAIGRDDLEYVAKNMVNVLESVTIERYPIIDEIKEDMMNSGAIGSIMSGSGPTVFGFFNTEKELEEAKAKLEKKVKLTFKTKTI